MNRPRVATLLLVLGMPWWFREVTGSWRWGYLATVLTIFAPVTMWWSGRPINTLGFTFAGCALALQALRLAERRRWGWFILAIVVSAILLARFPTYYQPLAIIVGIPVLVATAGVILLADHPWRRRLVTLGAWAVATAVAMGALIVEHLPEIRAGLDTVYPGRRTSTGTPAPFGWVFGAPELAFLKEIQGKLVAVNATEIGSSFTVLLGVVVILLLSRRWHPTRSAAVAFWVCGLIGLFWLSWCTLNWGSLGEKLPLANLVPYFRAVNGVGVVVVIAFCLLMAQWKSRSQVLGVVSGLLTAGVTLLAGLDLMSETMPLLTRRMVWVSSVVAGALVYLLVSRPQSRWPLVATGAAVVVMTLTVNPLLFGLADLRVSPTAQYFMAQGEQARTSGQVWATDSIYTDALLLATGTPALTTRQQIGPDTNEWQRLDPELAQRDVWNRGGSYVTFTWSTDPGIEMSNPSPDVVLVKASPCTVAQRIPELRHVVSKRQLTDGCLQPAGTIQWSGDTQYVYDLR